jgi:hypothetical protein
MKAVLDAPRQPSELNWDLVTMIALDVALWMFAGAMLWSLAAR